MQTRCADLSGALALCICDKYRNLKNSTFMTPFCQWLARIYCVRNVQKKMCTSSKCSDENAHLCRLVGAFAVCKCIKISRTCSFKTLMTPFCQWLSHIYCVRVCKKRYERTITKYTLNNYYSNHSLKTKHHKFLYSSQSSREGLN